MTIGFSPFDDKRFPAKLNQTFGPSQFALYKPKVNSFPTLIFEKNSISKISSSSSLLMENFNFKTYNEKKFEVEIKMTNFDMKIKMFEKYTTDFEKLLFKFEKEKFYKSF